jgi:5'-nucleotidase
LQVAEATLVTLPVNADVPEAPNVRAFLSERRPPPEPPLGFVAEALARRSPLGGDSALGDLTADAMLGVSGADVALLNSSGLRADLEAGPLLRSDLELAFPFGEPWRLVRTSGAVLRAGLLRAAQRSVGQGCESSVQVAGMRLVVRCEACRAASSRCLSIDRPLDDGEWLLVALPEYLTLAGADFEALSGGTELPLSVPDALTRLIAARPALADPEPCRAALAGWPSSRCTEAFPEPLCPLASARAQAICSALPLLEDPRDGRIEMQP